MKKVKEQKTGCMVFVLFVFCLSQAFTATCGDVNSSGSIDIVDALLIAQYYVGLNPANFDPSAADVNADSSIDIIDGLRIAQYYVGLISDLSCSTTQTPAPTAAGTPVPAETPVPGCVHGQVKANEVIWIGDSWIQIPGTQHTRVRDLARAAGIIGPNEDYVDLAVSGSPIATIVNQYNTREAGSVKVKVILMDGGGIDTIQGGGSQSSINHVVTAFRDFLARVAGDGTVEHIIYFLYPELPTIAGVAALRPGMRQACEESIVPCYFLDLQPLWEGHPEYTGGDSIHPSDAGGKVIGEAIWSIMQQNCIAQ